MWLLNTQGRGKDMMITSLNLSITTVASIVAGLPFGPVGVLLRFPVSGNWSSSGAILHRGPPWTRKHDGSLGCRL